MVVYGEIAYFLRIVQRGLLVAEASWPARRTFKKSSGIYDSLENEEHFLLRCLHPNLKVHRENLLKTCIVLPSFDYSKNADKWVFLLSNCAIIFFSAKTCSKMLEIRTDVSRTDYIYFHFNIVHFSLFILYGLS